MLIALIGIAKLLLTVLFWIIVLQAVLSWLIAFNVINTQNDGLRQFLNALDRLTDPLYRPIRKIMPDFGGIDLSPMVVILLIIILRDYILDAALVSALRASV
ncbi:YggT family protein [Allosphingosinicella deserti]|uniref:Osmotic-shock protein n=1 Tax=Allosphingosinicella deserti TaxID=2116704 RepID=A0A2P7QWI0_9SPHN|nr:YggT family protein [Sphingomonas deserti]PSJ42293.1 osmotic-shock protein [Sphingomonas deserti]